MTDSMRRELMQELNRLHGTIDDATYLYLGRALELLPADVKWAIPKDARRILAHTVDRLFTVDVGSGNAPPEGAEAPPDWRASVQVTSRPFTAKNLEVVVAEGERIADEVGGGYRDRTWTFNYVTDLGTSHDWLRLVGRTTTTFDGREYRDRAEEFARSLADLAGWSIRASV